MLGNEAVNEIQQALGFRSDLQNEILFALQRAQQSFERSGLRVPSNPNATFYPWWLIISQQQLLTTADLEFSVLPDGFLAEVEEDVIHLKQTNAAGEEERLPLLRDDRDYLRAQYPAAESGPPKAYALDRFIYWFPTPDAVYTMLWRYYDTEPVVQLSQENLWMKHGEEILIGEAGRRIAFALRDERAAAYFTERLQLGLATAYAASEERKHTNRKYVIGGVD